MHPYLQRLRSCALVVLLLGSTMAAADSWAPATVETTMSANGRYRVIVTPRPLGGALPYFRDKVAGVEPAGQRAGSAQTVPTARVERRWKRGAWALVWEGPLVNDVAPVSVLLSDDGARLVTFDNWHSVGFGEDVVVIYDARGGLVRKLSLEDILPPYYIPHLPRSVSSRSWGGSHRLVDDDRQLELVVARPGVRRDREYSVPVRIQLSDGTLLPGTGEAWERAVAEAKALESERVAAWQAVRQRRVSPLPAPATGDVKEWRSYMFELRDRIEAPEERMGGMLLADAGDGAMRDSGDAIAMEIGRFDASRSYQLRSFIFASPDSEELAALLTTVFGATREGVLAGAHYVFVGTAEEGHRVRDAARHTGARITLVDSTDPFPPGTPLPEDPGPFWHPR